MLTLRGGHGPDKNGRIQGGQTAPSKSLDVFLDRSAIKLHVIRSRGRGPDVAVGPAGRRESTGAEMGNLTLSVDGVAVVYGGCQLSGGGRHKRLHQGLLLLAGDGASGIAAASRRTPVSLRRHLGRGRSSSRGLLRGVPGQVHGLWSRSSHGNSAHARSRQGRVVSGSQRLHTQWIGAWEVGHGGAGRIQHTFGLVAVIESLSSGNSWR